MLQKTARVFIVFAVVSLFIVPVFAVSEVIKFSATEVEGQGPLPYNYRIIDGHIHVGGHPLNPKADYGNIDKQVTAILDYLKSKGVETVIDLDNTPSIQDRYQNLLKKSGLKRIQITMNAERVPSQQEWQTIKETLKNPVYMHCKWGADRCGAIIGRYLVEEKGYTPRQAFEAVITSGSHAGPLGGLKTGPQYAKMVTFFWPPIDAAEK